MIAADLVVGMTDPILLHDNCLDVLRTLDGDSVDAIVTDPPYGLAEHKPDALVTALTAWANGDRERVPDGRGFMGKTWDAFVPPPAVWDECLRVLKPGGYLAAFSGSRTVDLMGLSIRMAGFEIRDSLQWIMGSGYPKSRNVTADLDALPRCDCGIAEIAQGSLGVEQAGLPAGAVGAGVRAERGAVSLAGLTADGARGQRLEPASGPLGRIDQVQPVNADLIGQRDPVVLGSASVTGPAEGEQVVGGVRGVEVDPEPLRDEVVGEQAVDGSAIGTGPVALDHLGGDAHPLSPLVLPLPAAPGGVSRSGLTGAVVEGHASAGAVDGDVGPSTELAAADLADVNTVAGGSSSHDLDSTAEHRGLRRCDACNGLIGEVPRGLGTALKPAVEPIVLARKPLGGTVAANVLAHGTGALNIDACRVAHASAADLAESEAKNRHTSFANPGSNRDSYSGNMPPRQDYDGSAGRWPSNVLLDEHAAAELDAQSGTTTSTQGARRGASVQRSSLEGGALGAQDRDRGRGDSGGASRFFPTFRYQAKAPTRERPKVDGVAHPTVKPLALMRWLVRLVTPPGGVVLDPFAGSGTTLQAARDEGFWAIGIEREWTYYRLACTRLGLPDPGPAEGAAS